MEVNLSPDLEGKLARAADRRGVSADVLIREAIERAVDYDDWFVREVERGLAQIDAGQVLTHDAVGPAWSRSWPNINPVADATPVDPGGSCKSRAGVELLGDVHD